MKRSTKINTLAACSAMSAASLFLSAFFAPGGCRANDSMFPPAASARPFVDIDGKGFIIRGKRTFVVSAGIEYARIPRELWRDRLLKLQRAGFNCVEVYTFWNYHEPHQGQFDFSGNHDLDAFLKLAQSLGLYATVRVGPYYCAEWDSGGYPIWLRFQSGLKVRTDNAVFEDDVRKFWAHLMPIVARNQINHGGNVIMVQLENEHGNGWGTEGLYDPYLRFLQTTALADGLEVPYFFSGLHHGSEPGGSGPGSNNGRTSPWFSTEFWCDWYNNYGESDSDVIGKDRATWKILAYGGNGYNYYMADGGSNFDYFNNNEDVSSYDYGAAIGEGGDLRPQYYKFKRAAWFARSFQDVLENDGGANARQDIASNPSLAVSERQGPAGKIFFLDNAADGSQDTKVTINGVRYPQTGSLSLNPHEIAPVVTDYALPNGVTLDVAPTRILGITQQGNTSTIVIYGRPGSPAELYFSVPKGTQLITHSPGLSLDASGRLTLQTEFSSGAPSSYSFKAEGKRVRILAMNEGLADRTWPIDVAGQTYIVVGPQYVGNAVQMDGGLRIATQKPWESHAPETVLAFGQSDAPGALRPVLPIQAHSKPPVLSAWRMRSGTAPGEASYDTTDWLAGVSGPQQMGADGDVSAYAWYRCKFNVPDAGPYVVSFANVGDRMEPFVDGVAVPANDVSPTSFRANLTAGSHDLAIFTAHYGRDKGFGYSGPIDTFHSKGLVGPAELQQFAGDPATTIVNWKMIPAAEAAVDSPPPSADQAGWTEYKIGGDAFDRKTGYAWIQTVLPVSASGEHVLNFSSVDDNCWVYLNGVKIASHQGWNTAFQVNLTGFKPGGQNVLTLLVQNTDSVGGIDSNVTMIDVKSSTRLDNWVQKGGPGNPDAATGWHPLAGQVVNGPCFYKTTFSVPIGQSCPTWRVVTTGLSRGSVWVNGHNLGRYPQNSPAPGVYIPECWLMPGKNTLEIFDEDGAFPNHVQIVPEIAASRDQTAYTGKIGG